MAYAPLNDVEIVSGIPTVPLMLDIICRVSGMRFAAVARIIDGRWVACAVKDDIGFQIGVGDELKAAATIFDQVRDSGVGTVVDDATQDPIFNAWSTPESFGFQSYISMPVFRASGEFFGTVCALDSAPARLSDPHVVGTLKLFADLIGRHLDDQDAKVRGEAALSEAQEVARLREQFIAVVGHDLRNPLAAVQAGVALLSRKTLDSEARLIVDHIEESCQRMKGLIANVLDFAQGRLGGGLPLARTTAHDLGEMLERVTDELRSVHPERSIHSHFQIDNPVVCDAPRIGQLLSNLLGNAVTHGSPHAPVEVCAWDRDGMLVLKVINEGRPIEIDAQRRLFHPFARGAENSTEGLGLGLYIASEIAKAHGGALEVESVAGQTTFTLTIPAGAQTVPQQMAISVA